MKKRAHSSTVFLVLCTVYLVGSAHLGTKLYDRIFETESVSANASLIAGMEISNESKDNIKNKLNKEIQVWKENQNVKAAYLEVEEPIPSDIFQFDVNASVDKAVNGEDSPLILHIDDERFLEVVSFLGMDRDLIQIDKLKEAVMAEASMLEADVQIFDLEDFMKSPDAVKVLAENEIAGVGATKGLDAFLSSFKEIVIEPLSTFSLLKVVEDQKITSMTNEELSVISTGLYETLLYSDLQVIQRHQGSSLPEYAELGFEARVDQGLQQDFVFINPTNQANKIRIDLNGDTLVFVLEGPRQPYEVEISLQNKQTVEPRVIKQYSPYVNQGQTNVRAEGKDGVQTEVWRKMVDSGGKVLKEELISSDYYPPVHREELVSLEEYMVNKENVLREGEEPVTSTGSGDDQAEDSDRKETGHADNLEEDKDDQPDLQHVSPGSESSSSGEIPNPDMK
jgi:hypothetical protein